MLTLDELKRHVEVRNIPKGPFAPDFDEWPILLRYQHHSGECCIGSDFNDGESVNSALARFLEFVNELEPGLVEAGEIITVLPIAT